LGACIAEEEGMCHGGEHALFFMEVDWHGDEGEGTQNMKGGESYLFETGQEQDEDKRNAFGQEPPKALSKPCGDGGVPARIRISSHAHSHDAQIPSEEEKSLEEGKGKGGSHEAIKGFKQGKVPLGCGGEFLEAGRFGNMGACGTSIDRQSPLCKEKREEEQKDGGFP